MLQPNALLTGTRRLLVTKKRKGRLSPEQTTAKFNCERLSRYRYCGHATGSPQSCRLSRKYHSIYLHSRAMFPNMGPRNPSVAHNVIRSSATNSKISEHRFWNTATSSKYPAKYRGKFCPSIGNTGEIPVRCQLRQFLFRLVRI